MEIPNIGDNLQASMTSVRTKGAQQSSRRLPSYFKLFVCVGTCCTSHICTSFRKPRGGGMADFMLAYLLGVKNKDASCLACGAS